MTFKIIICGSREFDDYARLKNVCDDVVSEMRLKYQTPFLELENIEVVSGNAKGADLLGEQWAKSYGHWRDKKRYNMGLKIFPLLPSHWTDMDVRPDNEVFPKTRADGTVYNALAGSNRNLRMLDYALSDGDIAIVIAFYKGKSSGSKNMIKVCKKAGVEHFIWDDDKQKMRK